MANGQAMLDLTDIQGNILRGYRHQRFARFMPFRILAPGAARKFLGRLLPFITPGDWGAGGRPDTTTNIAISFPGLRALELPYECLITFPVEFQDGMRARAKNLGDTDCSAPDKWDPPWNGERVHFVVMVYAVDEGKRQERCNEIARIVADINGGPDETAIATLKPQDAHALMIDGTPTRKEHFGFVDGISNPDVERVPENGQGDDIGNPNEKGVFRKIPAGEFILGYPGEGGEVAPMPLPRLLGRNGSYLVIRKLEQHVEEFRKFIAEQAALIQKPAGTDPEHFLAAKMMGRWQDGSPLIGHPNGPGQSQENGFGYANDLAGAVCPLGAHIRRANPRDSLGFGGKVMSRHRLIRRGIPYGNYLPHPDGRELPGGQPKPYAPAAGAGGAAADERGIMFLAYNSGFDQFEFVQQTWINFGDDFQQGNDMDPITGSGGDRRMMIPGDEKTGRRPFLCSEIPRFVTTKGGDYFFVPSLTGLRLMASGQVVVS